MLDKGENVLHDLTSNENSHGNGSTQQDHSKEPANAPETPGSLALLGHNQLLAPGQDVSAGHTVCVSTNCVSLSLIRCKTLAKVKRHDGKTASIQNKFIVIINI